MTEEEWDRVQAINTKGVWLSMKYEIPAMVARGGGAIVNASSILGLVGAANGSLYSSTKHAVAGLTRSAALDYAPAGIRVNATSPGMIETPLMERTAVNMEVPPEAFHGMHPLGRMGRSPEVADAVLWLCSDAASFVTGRGAAGRRRVLGPMTARSTLEELADQHEIEQLMYRYATGIDTADYDLVDSVFTDDGEIDYAGIGGPRGRWRRRRAAVERGVARRVPGAQALHHQRRRHVRARPCRPRRRSPTGVRRWASRARTVRSTCSNRAGATSTSSCAPTTGGASRCASPRRTGCRGTLPPELTGEDAPEPGTSVVSQPLDQRLDSTGSVRGETMPGRLAGKVALISGTAGGQGRRAAVHFAAEGAKIVGCDVKVAEARGDRRDGPRRGR